ncbi:sigma-70 family RNA polymerase sigma factor [Candidatus Gottesmanbacteria bacterium]|nr:sigma-70 family RNA polymerase sigma factor [Candidatus Gottesmanbacteria bacterium]
MSREREQSQSNYKPDMLVHSSALGSSASNNRTHVPTFAKGANNESGIIGDFHSQFLAYLVDEPLIKPAARSLAESAPATIHHDTYYRQLPIAWTHEPLDLAVRSWLWEQRIRVDGVAQKDERDMSDLFGIYTGDTSGIPEMLFMGEDSFLGKAIAVGKRAQHKLEKLMQKKVKFSPSTRMLFEAQAMVGEAAKGRLVTAFTHYALKLAAKAHGYYDSVPLLDLVQEANKALLRAADRYDYQRSIRFWTYATAWIKRDLGIYIARNAASIGEPLDTHTLINWLLRLEDQLQKDSIPPSDVELSEIMGISIQRVQKYREIAHRRPVSLDRLAGESGKDTEWEVTPIDSMDIEDLVIERETAREAVEAVNGLPFKHRRVIYMYTGFDGETIELEEIGVRFGFSRQRAHELKTNGLKKVRNTLLKNV